MVPYRRKSRKQFRSLLPGTGLSAAPIIPRIRYERGAGPWLFEGRVLRARVPGSGLSAAPLIPRIRRVPGSTLLPWPFEGRILRTRVLLRIDTPLILQTRRKQGAGPWPFEGRVIRSRVPGPFAISTFNPRIGTRRFLIPVIAGDVLDIEVVRTGGAVSLRTITNQSSISVEISGT